MGGPGSGGTNKLDAQRHRLRGTFRARRHAHDTRLKVAASAGGKRIPGWLTRGLGGPGREFCLQTYREHDGWGRHALELLRLAAQALDTTSEARRTLSTEGALLKTSTGRAYAHPLIRLERQSALLFATLLGRLRLDVQIKTASEADQAEERELAAILAIK